MRRAMVVAVLVACGAGHYVYTARRFDASAQCLDPYRSIDFVNGDAVSSKCAPNCFEYGGETFTSTVCPPLPELATPLDLEAPECKAALALYDTTCGGDSGIAYADAGPDVVDAADGGDQ